MCSPVHLAHIPVTLRHGYASPAPATAMLHLPPAIPILACRMVALPQEKICTPTCPSSAFPIHSSSPICDNCPSPSDLHWPPAIPILAWLYMGPKSPRSNPRRCGSRAGRSFKRAFTPSRTLRGPLMAATTLARAESARVMVYYSISLLMPDTRADANRRRCRCAALPRATPGRFPAGLFSARRALDGT